MKVENLFAKLFSRTDLSQAYWQFPLDDESKKVFVINTH